MTRVAITTAAIAAVTLLASCGGGGGPEPEPPPQTFSKCDTSATENGDVAAAESGAGGLTGSESAPAPEGVLGWTMRYCSTGRDDSIVEVTGLLATPDGDAPEGGWPLIAFAHGTAGLGDQCAPSTSGIEKMLYLETFIGAGYAIVASDFAGLGTDGIPGFLIGESEGRSVLDSARAARGISGANIGPQTMIVGYSQGGHAALFAGELAPTYAPEIDVVAVAALAPPTDLTELTDVRFNEPNSFDTAAPLIASWVDYYGQDPSSLVTAQGAEVLDIVVNECTGRLPQAQGPVDDFLQASLLDIPEWAALLEENSTGQSAIAAPVFIAQGGRDKLVPLEVTRSAIPDLCAINDNLRYQEYDGVSHGNLRLAAADDMLQFLADGLAGQPSEVGADCASVN
jgi:pimeloyl-ACP methyl ester carboxylesterase